MCKEKVIQIEGEVAVRCPNNQCVSQQKNAIIHFASRNNFNIDGMGEKVVSRLVDKGLVNDVADIFVLTKDAVKTLDGFEEKSAQNLIDAINASKQVSFAKFLSALNILYVGTETAEYVAQHFKTLKALQNTTQDELESIHGVGDAVAQSLLQWFSEKQNQQLVQRLFDNGVIIKKEATAKTTLQGKSFVFTGTLDSMGREQAQQKVRELGGRVSSAVSSQTDFVVYGEGWRVKARQSRTTGRCVNFRTRIFNNDSMSISEKDIQHIADLARLGIPKKEIPFFAQELSKHFAVHRKVESGKR